MLSIKRTSALFAVLLLAVSAATQAGIVTKAVKPLYAGQNMLVGSLVVKYDNVKRQLIVTYDMTKAPDGVPGYVPGWTLQTTHLYVGKSKPTSAAPGRFPFKHEGLSNATTDKYTINLATLKEVRCYTTWYIAAHADTCAPTGPCVPDFSALVDSLPTGLASATLVDNMAVLNPGPSGTANWSAQSTYTLVASSGSYLAWCVDSDGPIDTGVDYSSAYVPSVNPDGTYNLGAAALVGTQAASDTTKLKLLTYLLNQPYVRDCGTPGSPYSARDIQVAIWVITNGLYTPATVSSPEVIVIYKYLPASQTFQTKQISSYIGADVANVRAILQDVDTNAATFVPECGQQSLVLVDPQTPLPAIPGYDHNQHLAFVLPLSGSSTVECETLWAFKQGCDPRIGTGWARYFTISL